MTSSYNHRSRTNCNGAGVSPGPREKALKRGVRALTTYELLQLLIGSGTRHASVQKIARKVETALRHFGAEVTYQHLRGIDGIGPARLTLLLAVFELAARFPRGDTADRLVDEAACHAQLIKRKLRSHEYGYITLDGGYRILHQRIAGSNGDEDTLSRQLSSDTIADNAAIIQVGRYEDSHVLIPSLADLSLAKAVVASGRLLGYSAHYMLFNDRDWHSVTKDVLHVQG